jgi:hypothetical protein
MNPLNHLTPAETLLIRSGPAAPLNDLLKYTLMDLIYKQVLELQETKQPSEQQNLFKSYRYIGIGRQFHSFTGMAHELVFLSPFLKNHVLKMLFDNMVRIGYEHARSKTKYTSMVLKSVALQDLFDRSWRQRIFGGFSYTSRGTSMKYIIENEFEALEKLVATYKENKDQSIPATLQAIGGNIFLLSSFDTALAKEIQQQLQNEFDRRSGTDISGCSIYYWPTLDSSASSGCWSSFDSHSHSSGCSSDSGCSSGDSGCSGCGGCGGGD